MYHAHHIVEDRASRKSRSRKGMRVVKGEGKGTVGIKRSLFGQLYDVHNDLRTFATLLNNSP
jgi:hypothetical protein